MLFWTRICSALALMVLGLVLSGCGLARGSDYPTSDITFVVPYAPGGSADPVARVLTQDAESIINKKFIIVNKAGASGSVGVTEVIQSKPDGYTVGLGSMVTSVMTPLTVKTAYGGPEDYQPLVHLIWQPSTIAVKADSPFKTFDDLVAEAKKRPGGVRVGISSKLDNDDLAIQQLNSMYKLEITTVPFSGGGGESITALLGGHIEAAFGKAPQLRPLVDSGKVRPLAVIQSGGSQAFPQVPTVQKLGYNLTIPWTGYFVFGPKGMEKPVVEKLAKTLTEAAKRPGFQKLVQDNGFTVDLLGPDQLTAEIKRQWGIFSTILKELKVQTVR